VAITHASHASRTKPPLRRLIELTGMAPSVHNTQPWSWFMTDAGLELHADSKRQLELSDPTGRNMVISCGAALDHLQVAARALGWETEVARVPDGPDSSVLARIQIRRGEASDSVESDLKAIVDRCTDRRRFTSWPVPDDRLQHLADAASAKGVHAVPLVDVSERFRAERLVERALELQAKDADLVVEQEEWVDHSTLDGIPSKVLGLDVSTTSGARPDRFSSEVLTDEASLIEGSDGLIVLCSGSDDVGSWLRAGEGLSALWLMATTQGLSVVPLSQVVEVDETRLGLQHDVLGGLAHPLLLVRIGWQSISRSLLQRTSRRLVDDVLTSNQREER
jgi:hypothetical protein